MQKEEFRNCQAQPIKAKSRPIELQFCRILNKAQQPTKCLGIESNTTRYKRKILLHFFQVLRVTSVRSVRFCNLLTLQSPTKDQIHIASIDGIKLLLSLQQSSVLKIKAWPSGSCENKIQIKEVYGVRAQFGNCVGFTMNWYSWL